MKYYLVLTINLLFMINISFASQYETAMKSAIRELSQANENAKFSELAAKFERIGKAENDEWLPHYYASLSYIWKSHRSNDRHEVERDLETAQSMLDIAKERTAENDEMSVASR